MTLACERDDATAGDQVVRLEGVTWAAYERLLRERGESSAPRITYLEGTVEIMSPGIEHERIKSMIACLVEAYCLERGIRFTPYGSWTIKKKAVKRGAEADECYVFGAPKRPRRPHLAIEVVQGRGGLSKLEVWRRLGVRELWLWRRGRLTLHRLRREAFEEIERSLVLPDLDLELLVRFIHRPTAYDAITDYRTALRA